MLICIVDVDFILTINNTKIVPEIVLHSADTYTFIIIAVLIDATQFLSGATLAPERFFPKEVILCKDVYYERRTWKFIRYVHVWTMEDYTRST